MATVKKYSLKWDGDKKLSKNFSVREFRCKDGSDQILICQQTVNILQAVRNYFGKPVTINSAYRTPSWNKKVGGASASQHVKGTACDIRVEGVPSWAVAAYLEANYPKHGIGLYSNFVHIDARGKKVYWKNTGSNVVNSFYRGYSYQKYKAVTKQWPVKKKEEQEVTQQQFETMYYNMLDTLSKKPPSDWGQELNNAINWAKKEGIIKGDKDGNLMMQNPVTRQELALILYRLNK